MSFTQNLDRFLARTAERPGLWNWLGGVLMFVLPFLQHWMLWYPSADNRFYLKGDFIENFGPRSYAYQSLLHGHLPLWDPFRETGLPTLDYLFDLFNPAVVLMNIFFLDDGMLRNHSSQITMVAHYAIGALGAYMWGLSLGLGRCSSLLMGLVVCSGGNILVRSAAHDAMVRTVAWLPYVFMLLDLARRKKSMLYAAWGGVFLALLFTGGHPQFFYMTVVFLGLYVAYYLFAAWQDEGSAGGIELIWKVLIPFGVLAFLIAAPPLAHMLGEGLLGGLKGVHPSNDLGDLVFTQQGSGEIRFLPYFLLPNLEGGHIETYVYAGVFPLIMGLATIYYLRGRAVGYWKLMLAAALVLMLSNTLGMHKFMIDLVPGYIYFRENCRYVYFMHLALALLAAYGLHWLLASPKPPDVGKALKAVALLGAMLGGAVLLTLVILHIDVPDLQPRGPRLTLNALTAALIMVGITWLILKRASQNHRGIALRLMIAALLIIDLAFYHLPMTATDRGFFRPDPSRVDAEMEARSKRLRELAGEQHQRFVTADNFINQNAAYRYQINFAISNPTYLIRIFSRAYWDIRWRIKQNPHFMDLLGVKYIQCDNEVAQGGRSQWEVVNYSQASIGLRHATAVESLQLQASGEFLHGAQKGDLLAWLALLREGRVTAKWPLRLGREINGGLINLPLEGALQADEIILASAHADAGVEFAELWLNGKRVSQGHRLQPAEMGLCRNLNALPLVYFVGRAAPVIHYGEYLAALGSVDPHRCVLFREKPAGYEEPRDMAVVAGGQADMTSWEPERVTAKVKADQDGYLVMSQTASYGWNATIDGESAPVLRAYGFLCALQIPAGEHQIVFEYREPLVWVGVAVAIISFLGLVALSLLVWRRRRKA